jgi:hypothetical protein
MTSVLHLPLIKSLLLNTLIGLIIGPLGYIFGYYAVMGFYALGTKPCTHLVIGLG